MDSRPQVTTASGINVLAGIWLIIAPFILGYANSTPTTNDIWLGIIVGILALIRIFSNARSTWLSGINVLAGIWLIIAPFVLSYANNTPRVNDIVLGIIVIAFALWSGGASTVTRTHRGPAPA